MFKDPWSPQEIEIRNWAYSDDPWPEQDWDIGINDGNNDSLLIELALDQECPKRNFFIHAIYFMVGEVIHSKESEKRKKEVLNLVTPHDKSNDNIIKKWAQESKCLLNGEIEFEYGYWCDHMFYEN